MPDTVLIINGATRTRGNTDIIVEKIIDGIKDSGTDVELIKLREKNISNCIGCYQCMKRSTCSFDDDMTDIRKYINEIEVMILASPLYWCGVTGLMKVFLDRLFFYYHSKNRSLIAGKQAIIVTPMNQKDIGVESELLVEFYRRLFNCLGVGIVDMFYFNDIMEKGAVLDKPKHLEQAYSIGANLKKLRSYEDRVTH